jgi:catalase
MIMPKKNKTDGKKNPAMEEKKSAQYSDQTVATGTAGEVHQTAGGDVPLLTTQQGCLFPMIRIAQDRCTGTDGARGFSF